MTFPIPVATFLLSLSLLGAISASAADQPNIVLILSDDMAWYGTGTEMEKGRAISTNRFRDTPNIDGLAERGLTFSRAYAAAGMCAPSRCSIQTGQTAARTRFSGNGNFGTTDRTVVWELDRRSEGKAVIQPHPIGSLDPETPTIADHLNALGYATAHVGKWHAYGGELAEAGYQVHDGETSNAEGNSKDPEDPKNAFSMTAKALAFVEEQAGSKTPFFVQISHYAEHNAVQSRPATLEARLADPEIASIKDKNLRKSVAARSAMVADFDTCLGDVIDRIDALGLTDSTYIIFTADNGHHRDTPDPKPLRGDKWWLWECGIRVPMIVAGPGISATKRSTAPVVGYDFLPTFVDMAGGDVDALADVDGISLLPHLLASRRTTDQLNQRPLFFHYPHHRNTAPHSAIIVGNHKLFRFYERPESLYLYDLEEDIGETTNISQQMPELAARLAAQLDGYHTEIDAALPKPNPEAPEDYQPYDPDNPDCPTRGASH